MNLIEFLKMSNYWLLSTQWSASPIETTNKTYYFCKCSAAKLQKILKKSKKT